MNEYNEGDVVEAVQGSNVRRGLVTTPPNQAHAKLQGKCLHEYESEGWTLTVIYPAAPKVVLPNEPGIYADRVGDVWLLTAGNSMHWLTSGPNQRPLLEHYRNEIDGEAATYAPFTRLESRADTAKAVLERTTEILGNAGIHTLPIEYGNLATEFGVTS